MQYANKHDLQAYTLSSGNALQHSPVYGWSISKHAVSEGLFAMGVDKWPEANLLIEFVAIVKGRPVCIGDRAND
jgi:hypothetical protein